MIRLFLKKQKALLSGVLLFDLFLMSALPASAGLFGGAPPMPNPSSFFSSAENRYHVDPEALQSQGESFNTSANKQLSPTVTLFFNPSDPRPGEKITAKAFPTYFAGTEKDFYYTWYLKHTECALSSANLTLCDADDDGRVTVEDWKIEAMRIIAKRGFVPDPDENTYTTDTDDDGYKAIFGGANKKGVSNHCYVHDVADGKSYELGKSGDISFACPSGFKATCLEGEGQINPVDITIPGDGGSDPINPVPPTPGSSGPAFNFSDTGVCRVSGLPYCSDGGPRCGTGTPRCVDKSLESTTSCGEALTSCSGGGAFNPSCDHLFPNALNAVSGDGIFKAEEERFWGTSSQDPSTADNGNKDEANVVGLGQGSFEWNYAAGDQVGVVVEGPSLSGTKYADSSPMIMWAFSKGDCPLSLANSTGSFYEKIKNYQVSMLSAEFDLNKCLERNLVDPTQGGQATSLDISVTATPDAPLNDATFDGGGDEVTASASSANATKDTTEMLFDWTVEMSNNPQFKRGGSLVSEIVTSDLQRLKLLGSVKGTALDTIAVKLDIKENEPGPNPDPTRPPGPEIRLAEKKLSEYNLIDGIGYLRFTAKALENFSSGVVRKGKSDVIVKFISTDKKISAHKVETVSPLVSEGRMQVKLIPRSPDPETNGIICVEDALDKVACRVIKNEIIGLSVESAELSNFQWSINGAPLTCIRGIVSPECASDLGEQNHINFFPVSGNVGDTYTVTLNANDIKTGKTVTLARTFHVIEPSLSIVSADLNTAWPKLEGQYKDINGPAVSPCPNARCNQYSDLILEGFATEKLQFKLVSIPNFLASRVGRQWTVDGILIDAVPATGFIEFDALKAAPDVYNIALAASLTQSDDMRRALRDIWNISPLESPELHFSAAVQVELKEPGFAQGTLQGTKKYLAALTSYIPASVMFLFRIILSVILLLFTARFFLALLPERLDRAISFERRRS